MSTMTEKSEMSTEETNDSRPKTIVTPKPKTKTLSEVYTMNGVESLELISNHIINLLTIHDVKTATLTLRMSIETDDLETEKQVQTQSLTQAYVVSGAEALPMIFDHIQSLYNEHSVRGVKSAKIAIALKLFVPKE